MLLLGLSRLSLFQRVPPVLWGNESPLCGLSLHIPFLYCHSIWFLSLTLAFMRLNYACLYAIVSAFTFLYSQLHEVKIFILLPLYHLQYLEQCLACNRCSQNVCSVETTKGGRCHCVIKRELNLGVCHLTSTLQLRLACDIHFIMRHLSCLPHKTGKSTALCYTFHITHSRIKLISMRLLWNF